MIFKRTIFKSVLESLDEYPVTLITGARQVGKTTLVSYFEKNANFKYLSFDDTNALKEAKENPKKFLEKYGYPLILDEVQRVPAIFIEIECIVNEVRKNKGSQAANGMYILTGSQKFNLMKEVSESMSGRVGIINMQPLSQAEIRGWDEIPFKVDNDYLFNLEEKRQISDDEIYKSIINGFYPARWEIENKPIKNYYSNYIKTYIDRDVSQLINLTDKQKFENLLRILASLTGEEFIADNIAKTLGVDKNTVNAWTNIAITGDIITMLPPYYEDSINKRIIKRNKLYFNDTGLACYLLGIDTPQTLKRSAFKGRIFETYIFNEIRKSYLNNNIEPNFFFYRDNNQNEIDLIILNDGKLYLVESKSGKNFSKDDIKGFKQVENSKYDIMGKTILCLTDESYRILSNVYAFNVKCI